MQGISYGHYTVTTPQPLPSIKIYSVCVPSLSSARKNKNCKEYLTSENKGKDDLKSGVFINFLSCYVYQVLLALSFQDWSVARMISLTCLNSLRIRKYQERDQVGFMLQCSTMHYN